MPDHARIVPRVRGCSSYPALPCPALPQWKSPRSVRPFHDREADPEYDVSQADPGRFMLSSLIARRAANVRAWGF